MPIARQLQNMGMPLYGMQPPTGYSMKADAWVNSSALLGRMNFALAMTSGKVKGVQVDSERLPGQNDVAANVSNASRIIFWQEQFPSKRTKSSSPACRIPRSLAASWTIRPAHQTQA